MKDKKRLLNLYFILLKLSYLISAVLVFSLLSEGFNWVLFGALMTGLSMLGLQFFAATRAWKMIEEKHYAGLVIAIVLNSMILPTHFFLLSFFGFYILLHSETRESFPKDKNPEWLNDTFAWLDNTVKDFKKTA